MRAKGMFLISFKVDRTNRGHGHLVVCSTKSVDQGVGKLCDAIVRLSVEASRCRRKMDYSPGLSVFEFADAEQADAMVRQTLPKYRKPNRISGL
jgi:hypothetical protein